MKTRLALSTILTLALLAPAPAAAEPTSKNSPWLEKLLKRFPAADADGDGVLTLAEAKAHREKQIRARGDRPRRPAGTIGPKPTHPNVAYNAHVRTKLDFWKAPAETPTPVIVFIHGGGFRGGDKSQASQRYGRMIKECLAKGVSFASVNYCMTGDGVGLPHCLRDSGRAIQFLRHNAATYNIDPKRIAAFGGSAGAGTSMWLGFHDDLADADSKDPVERQSTRLAACGAFAGQCTYDFQRWPELIGPPPKADTSVVRSEFLRIMGITGPADLDSPKMKAIRADVDMVAMLDAADAPVFLFSAGPLTDATNRGHYIHHPRHAVVVKAAADKAGVDAELHLSAKDPTLRGEKVNALLLKFFFKHLDVKPAPAKP